MNTNGSWRATKEHLEALAWKLRSDFRFFAHFFTPVKDKDGKPIFFDEWHGDLCRFMQGPEKDKLITLPRGHFKTVTCTYLYPLWRAICNPNIRIAIMTNNKPNAMLLIHSIKTRIETDMRLRALFPEVLPNESCRWSDNVAELKRVESYPEGTFNAVGIGSNVTGRRYDLIIEDDTVTPRIDDLTKREMLPDPQAIEKAKGYHRLTQPLLSGPEGERLFVGTRWSYDDVIADIQAEECDPSYARHYVLFERPALDRDGKPNCACFDRSYYRDLERKLGPFMYNLLYLNQAVPSSELMFDPEWLQYYKMCDLPEEGKVTITVDAADAPTGRSDQDYTAIMAGKLCDDGLYVLEYIHKRLGPSDRTRAAINLARKWKATEIRIETDRYDDMEEAVRNAMKLSDINVYVNGVKTGGSKKETRVQERLQPPMANGEIFILETMAALKNEIYTFPRGAHDDLVDALAWQDFPRVRLEQEEKKRELPKGINELCRTFVVDDAFKGTQVAFGTGIG